jgi:hypothetical protein
MGNFGDAIGEAFTLFFMLFFFLFVCVCVLLTLQLQPDTVKCSVKPTIVQVRPNEYFMDCEGD